MQYPTACSPQVWSTGSPLLFLRPMLGLEPVADHLIVDPAVPIPIGRIELLDIPGRWAASTRSAAGWSTSAASRKCRSRLLLVREPLDGAPLSGDDDQVAVVDN